MDEIDELNKKHALVQYQGDTLILTETFEDGRVKDITFSSTISFEKKYCNKKIPTNGALVKLGKAWLESPKRREYDGVDFNPAGTSPNIYNMWSGFAVKPMEGDCSKYLEHIYKNISSGDRTLAEYILNWMADAVQNPWEKPGTAIVLRGDQGTGKGVFVKWFGKLFDQYFAEVTNPNHFLGNFNSLLANKLLVFADEGFWAGEKKAEGILKGLITEDYIQIELKGRDVRRQRNFTRLIIASNNDWIVPASKAERRFVVMDVSSRRRQDHEYFAGIESEMKNGGLAALMHFLMNRDISKVNLRLLPQTEALFDQKIHSLSNIELWWYDCLSRGTVMEDSYRPGYHRSRDIWTDKIAVKDMYQSMMQSTKNTGGKNYLSEAQFGKQIRKLIPEIKKVRVNSFPHGDENLDSDGDDMETKSRTNVYEIPPLLNCRNFFSKRLGFSIDWNAV